MNQCQAAIETIVAQVSKWPIRLQRANIQINTLLGCPKDAIFDLSGGTKCDDYIIYDDNLLIYFCLINVYTRVI